MMKAALYSISTFRLLLPPSASVSAGVAQVAAEVALVAAPVAPVVAYLAPVVPKLVVVGRYLVAVCAKLRVRRALASVFSKIAHVAAQVPAVLAPREAPHRGRTKIGGESCGAHTCARLRRGPVRAACALAGPHNF